jgi:hypothetical protein
MAAFERNQLEIDDYYIKLNREIQAIVQSKTSVTRSNKGIFSCRLSAFIYCVIRILVDRRMYTRNIVADSKFITTQFQKLKADTSSDIYKVIFLNKAIHYDIVHPTYLREHSDMNTFFMCFKVRDLKSEERNSIISHYFVIVKRGTSYFVVSSYGSDNINVSLTDVEIPMSEFEEMITNFSTDLTHLRRETSTQLQRVEFLSKYFLNERYAYLPLPSRDPDDPRPPASIEIGLQQELQVYTDVDCEHDIICIPAFLDWTVELIDKSSGGKSRKKNKKTRNKKFKRSRR